MSGIDWLGEVNPAWGYAPLFTLGDPKKTPNTGMLESNLLSLSYGKIIRRDIESSEGLVPASYETYQIVEPGDTVLRFTDLQNDQRSLRSGLVRERGIITSAYLSFTPNKRKLNPTFFAHLMRAVDLSKVFYRMGSGVRQSLNWSEFSLMRLPLPSLEEQQRIADYLDRETAEIDAAVADLGKYVELLEKRRKKLSNDLVWTGRGERFRLKFLITEVDERAGDGRSDWPLISVSIHGGAYEREVDGTRIQATSDSLHNYKVVRRNDIVLNRMRAFQGALGKSKLEGITSPDYAVLRAQEDSAADWIAFAMKSPTFIDQMRMSVRGIGTSDQGNARTPRINVSQLFDLEIPFPETDLREAALTQFQQSQAEIDSLIAESTRLRELLLKRRSVLITEVVTGRKEV